MHPSLRLSVLNDLPWRARSMARAAAKGSLHELSHLCAGMLWDNDVTVILYLPVFYCNLEIGAIPTAAALDLDTPPFEVREAITKAVLALRGISDIDEIHMPSGACADLWPRLWKWTYFLYTYHEQLPPLLANHSVNLNDICVRLSQSVASFHGNERNTDLFSATPGFACMMAHAWRVLLRDPSHPRSAQYSLYQMACFFSTYFQTADPEIRQEFIEGAGGSIQDVAALVVEHLVHARRLRPGPHREYSLRSMLWMVDEMDNALVGSEPEFERDGPGPLGAALCNAQAIRSLTTIARELSTLGLESELPDEDSDPIITLEIFYKFLAQILGSSSGYHLLPEAIDAGLLVALASSIRAYIPDDDRAFLLITAILPSALVFCRVLSRLQVALHDIAEIEKDETFLNSQLFPEWKEFRRLLDERLRVLGTCQAATFSPMAACDNLACGRIGPKRELKRCAGCNTARYCSAACQTRDWRDDNHRTLCDPHRAFFLNKNTKFSAAQRSFFRLLLDKEYAAGEAHMLELQFLCRFGADTPFLTMFDYDDYPASGVPAITVHALEDAPWLGLAQTRHWEAEVARAAGSGGRVRLHVIRVAEAVSELHLSNCWLVPLRSESSAVYDGMKALVGELPRDIDTWDVFEVKERIRVVVEGRKEIH
ncbi:hypothetical protein C8R46DRAFT_1357643 [Mycena filopes]|nr:hypothetical protein C8R46DRAFT_1357643 [Mycena filopes]